MPNQELISDNLKLIESFGAKPISSLNEVPDFYTFKNGLMYSHRDFELFYKKAKNGTKSAIVSGFNASATMHIGHAAVFDTNLFFQKEFGANVFIPISEDESYVSLKIKTQEDGLRNSFVLARMMAAYGFNPSHTKIIIDQIYTNIYNIAIKLSRGVTLSEIRSVYGYTPDQNIGLHFYPSIQAAHVVLPQTFGFPNVLVPIGPDEDAHLRVCRDVAEKFGYVKPSVLHSVFLPGLDGNKMSKSKNNAIFFLDEQKEIKRKVMTAFSGGRTTVEEHRRLGGNPDVDVAYMYLKSYFLADKESIHIYDEYKRGKLLSGDLKKMLLEHIEARIDKFIAKYNKVTLEDLEKIILRDEHIDLKALIEKAGTFN